MIITAAEAARAERVLILNVTRIGDTLLATPAIRAIAAHFPNATITCLGHPQRAEVLRYLPYLGKVGAITKKSAWARGWKDAITKPEYDYAFVWGQDSALVRYALRKARRVVAECQQDDAINQKLALAFDAPPQNSIHAVAWFLALPAAVGIVAKGFGIDVAITKEELSSAAKTMSDIFGASNHSPIVGFQVASFATKSWRDWPIQRFLDLALRIVQHYPDARFVCFGASGDQPRIAELERSLGGRVISFAGKTTLRETAALMSHLHLFVGIDTGPTHLYSALKKPMVVLYHPSIPSALYKPLGHPALAAIDHALAGPTCRNKISMDEIDAELVWRAVHGALEGEPATFPGMPSPGIDAGVAPWPGDALPYI
ncbi:MAG: glycosyltransferase family 9 protein [Rhodocyclaceae bacterium]|nr:glycosyltransferase family 9 protein [Rhodocyclaceae bacterium]